MKKILLGTTALVSAGLVAGPALAGDPLSVSVSGSVVTGFYVVDADSVGTNSFQDTKVALVARNIDIIAEGTLDNGMTAGVDAKMMLGSDWNGLSATANPSDVTFRQLFAYLEGGFGRFEIGGVDGAAYKMHYTSPWFVPGNGVDSANIYNGVNSTTNFTRLTTFSLMATDANKITYFTPRFAGFQLGVSYTPDVGQSLTGPNGTNNLGVLLSGSVTGSTTDVFEIAANYAGTIGGVDLGVDGFYTDGDGNQPNTDPKEYGFGASAGYMGFTLGGAWTKREDVLGPTNFGFGGFIPIASLAVSGLEVETWTVGLSYGTGPWTVGVAYLNSQVDVAGGGGPDGAESDFWQVGGGYSLGSGVDLGLDIQFTSNKAASGAPTYDTTSGGLVLAVSF